MAPWTNPSSSMGDAAMDFFDIGKAHFPGHDDAAGAEVVMPELDTGPVRRITGSKRDGQLRQCLRQTENPRVGNEQGVYGQYPAKT